jgi:hypothetical protein
MTPAECEPTIPASERLQIHALDRAATGIGYVYYYTSVIWEAEDCESKRVVRTFV